MTGEAIADPHVAGARADGGVMIMETPRGD